MGTRIKPIRFAVYLLCSTVVAFLVSASITRRISTSDPTGKLQGPAAPETHVAQRDKSKSRLTAEQKEQIARGLQALADAKATERPSPRRLSSIPEQLGMLQEIQVTGDREEQRSAGQLRNQVRYALQKTVLPCWRNAPEVDVSISLRAQVRRLGQDFEVSNIRLENLSGFPAPRKSCLEDRLGRRRLVNGKTAVWTLARNFESEESFNFTIKRVPNESERRSVQ